MGINTFGKLFMPKNKIFYELFEEVATTVQDMGYLVRQVVYEPERSRRSALISQLEDMEHRNDDTTHKIFTELSRNFITPFDREDIHSLTSALDDICDFIFGSAKKINFYNVNPDDTGIRKMADLIADATTEIKTAVYGLRDMKNLRRMTEAMVKVNSIENQADDIYDLNLERLFENENDMKTFIKKREIYQAMEIVTDKCEDAANVIESIIVKYA
ncbi:DUF47 domain-containing protein [Ilyomonas limi]|uniref:DUF47 domain-containing protein n=1 Tax=Ilyomonas limi TaxID=2575867 RepID=A0A4U3KSQ8_9BACT|nr:DUF47 family protein [Ilyomonas limi]TKK65515.1 DUF47 domain-containing protein [Ilyomonas limi]